MRRWVGVGWVERLKGPEKADGSEEDGSDKGQDAFHGQADEAKWKGQQPDQRVKEKNGQGGGPAEDGEQDEEKEFEHRGLARRCCEGVRRAERAGSVVVWASLWWA